MTIVSRNYIEKQAESSVNLFCKRIKLGSCLKRANIHKFNGHSCLSIFQSVFSLVFSGKNLWRYLEREESLFQKDTVYRFLNDPHYN